MGGVGGVGVASLAMDYGIYCIFHMFPVSLVLVNIMPTLSDILHGHLAATPHPHPIEFIESADDK